MDLTFFNYFYFIAQKLDTLHRFDFYICPKANIDKPIDVYNKYYNSFNDVAKEKHRNKCTLLKKQSIQENKLKMYIT